MLSNEILPKFCPKFFCEKCDYSTSKKSSYDDHLLSRRHQKSMVLEQNVNKILPNSAPKKYTCQICNKEYKDNSGLWRHKKICINTKEIEDNSDVDEENEKQNNISNGLTEQLVIELIKQNKELLEIVKNGTHNNNSVNTTHTNSHNKAFNLQFFLNDTCRDAINITDFINSLNMELSDLINVGEKGYIEGITNIIVKNLKTLDVTKRPVHCTDKKRETVYIKDNNIWEKDEDKTRMHKLIKKVVSKNMNLLPKYKEKHPDCMTYHSKFNDQYNSIIYETMGGKGDNDYEKNERIIKNIVKQVVVDKGFE